jgi:non-heme chloroperoxidase
VRVRDARLRRFRCGSVASLSASTFGCVRSPVIAAVTIGSGTTLSYAVWGDALGAALVLLPGPTDSWRSYSPVLDRFLSSLRVVAVSQRGHGDSDKPQTGYRVEDFAGDVVPLLDALGIEQAVVAGHSGSCLVARRVALDHPERVAGLVLEASPTTLSGDPNLEGFIESVVSTLRDPIDPAFARSFVANTSSDDLPPALLDELAAEVLKVPARVWKETFVGLQTYNDMAELERLTVPTLLVWGDADHLVTRDMQDSLAERIRGAELRVYEGVRHTPRWEEPGRFATDVAAFVERRAARSARAGQLHSRGRKGVVPGAFAGPVPGVGPAYLLVSSCLKWSLRLRHRWDREATISPASQPGARPPAGGPMSSVQRPARTRCHDTSEFEFHISPAPKSSRPHVQVGNSGTSSTILQAASRRLLTRTGPLTAAATSGIVPPRQQRTS